MPTTIPFALRLRLWRETPADITLRLTQFLVAWRLAHPKPGDIAKAGDWDDDWDDDDNDCRTARPKPGQLSCQDTQKITRRVRRLSRAREDASGARQMRVSDLDRLRGIAGGVALAGPASEHAADTHFAALSMSGSFRKVEPILARAVRGGSGPLRAVGARFEA